MAKFKDLSLDLETGEHIDFDDADTIMMGYDGAELYINSTISGVRAAQPYHMVRYDQLTQASGILQDQIDNFTVSGTISAIDYAVDESLSSTTSTTFQEKLSLSSTVEAGEYIIFWYYEWSYKNGNFFFQAQLQLDNTENMMDHMQSPSNVDSWSPASGFKRISLSAATHTFDLDYSSSNNGKEAAIRKARLELWRLI